MMKVRNETRPQEEEEGTDGSGDHSINTESKERNTTTFLNSLDAAESQRTDIPTLEHQLAAIRRSRNEIFEKQQQQLDQCATLQEQLNLFNLEQEQALLEFRSALYLNRKANNLVKLSQQWSVLSDSFQISHRGPFGTINGLRLGAEAVVCAADFVTEADDNGLPTPPPPTRRVFSVLTESPNSPHSASSPGGGAAAQNIRVPWVEINSALGHVALLLATLESKPHVGIPFRHAILPMGSFSKIGLRRGESVSVYNLYSDDSFQFFGKRNFNTALQGLVECVADAAQAIQKLDRTIEIPHVIDKQRDVVTVGGLSIAYGNDGVEWTRAMKYVLTNIKHLLTYRGLTIWDP